MVTVMVLAILMLIVEVTVALLICCSTTELKGMKGEHWPALSLDNCVVQWVFASKEFKHFGCCSSGSVLGNIKGNITPSSTSNIGTCDLF
jgi:hypothetical protein